MQTVKDRSVKGEGRELTVTECVLRYLQRMQPVDVVAGIFDYLVLKSLLSFEYRLPSASKDCQGHMNLKVGYEGKFKCQVDDKER